MPQNTSQNPEGRQRQADEKASVISMQLAAKTGIEKRLYFYNELARMANGVIFAAQQGMEQAAMAWAGLNAMQQQKEQSWGTRGGLAAGITGSAVVGAAEYADT